MNEHFNRLIFLFLFLSVFIWVPVLQAQSQQNKTDSLDLEQISKQHSIHAALLPGWGQWENHQPWKTPIYAGIITTGLTLSMMQRKTYNTYHDAQLLRLDKDSTTIDAFTQISTADLLRISRKNKQLYHLAAYGTLFFYGMNIFDAYAFSKIKKNTHSPLKAGWYAALMPGLGQIYNKKYWKLPIVYAALGAGIAAITINTKNYYTYSDAYRLRTDGDPLSIDPFDSGLNYISDGNLLIYAKTFKDYRDISYLITGAVYALSIIDALVDAHLYHFDISDDLSLQAMPLFYQHNTNEHLFMGMHLSLIF